jgi:ABC-2 type transport system ATP-binding protein
VRRWRHEAARLGSFLLPKPGPRFHSFYPRPADLAEIVDSLDLAEKRNDYYRSLSGGLKQRVSVALALIGNPRVAVLDEMNHRAGPASPP